MLLPKAGAASSSSARRDPVLGWQVTAIATATKPRAQWIRLPNTHTKKAHRMMVFSFECLREEAFALESQS